MPCTKPQSLQSCRRCIEEDTEQGETDIDTLSGYLEVPTTLTRTRARAWVHRKPSPPPNARRVGRRGTGRTLGVDSLATPLATLGEGAEHVELGGRRIAEMCIWRSACLIFTFFWPTRTYVFQLETTSRPSVR